MNVTAFPLMSHRTRNVIALILILASFGCLAPGLSLPALTLDISPNLPFLGKLQVYHQTRSILGTLRNLHDMGNNVVAGLILLFSVVVPCAKGLGLLAVLASTPRSGRTAPLWRKRLYAFISLIGKWSMADVFVMGILLAFLAAGAAEGVTAGLETGFWFFLGYCLLSVASAQIMRLSDSASPNNP